MENKNNIQNKILLGNPGSTIYYDMFFIFYHCFYHTIVSELTLFKYLYSCKTVMITGTTTETVGNCQILIGYKNFHPRGPVFK